MNRRHFSSRQALLLAVMIVFATTPFGCRRRAAEVSEYKDPYPLPEPQPSVLRHRILWNSYNIYVK